MAYVVDEFLQFAVWIFKIHNYFVCYCQEKLVC